MKELLISTHVPHVPKKKKINPGPAERPETTNKRAQTTDLRPIQKKCFVERFFLKKVVRKKVRNQRPETKDQRPKTTVLRDL